MQRFSRSLRTADEGQKNEILFDLFNQLWETSGKAAVTAITGPFEKKIEAARAKNSWLVGVWSLNNGGTLTIGGDQMDRIEVATFTDSSVHVDELNLKSGCKESSDMMEYTGETCGWKNCEDAYNAHLTVKYDLMKDTIQGKIDVSPHSFVFLSNGDLGGVIEFTGKRVDDRFDDESESDY